MATKAQSTMAGAETGTVHRTLKILSALADQDRWPLNELSRHLQLPRASTHRLLNLCKPLGFVEQDDDGMYRASVELYRVAGKLSSEAPMNRLADPLLRAIRDQSQETATLTLFARKELRMFFSHVAYSANPLRYSVECNRLQPLAWGAAGHAILAFLSDTEIDQVIAQQHLSPLGLAPLPAAQLRTELAHTRQMGCATSFGQRAEDMHGIAVPFFDRTGQVRGNMLLSIPRFRYSPQRDAEFIELLRASAVEFQRRMGWSE